ncbi:MAG TPA: hypothetical protein VK636_10225 [Gemmatimonadaceae bacterium]|nr:hypothetical protein [Gemmatimonadaceae bacterium]
MKIQRMAACLVFAAMGGAMLLAGCAGESPSSEEQATVEPGAQADKAIDPEATASIERGRALGMECPSGKHVVFTSASNNADVNASSTIQPNTACPPADYYAHRDGVASGWIESWRVCHVSGTTYQICTGGDAPVRWYNPSSCNGTVQDWWPQGWHFDAQTMGGCC